MGTRGGGEREGQGQRAPSGSNRRGQGRGGRPRQRTYKGWAQILTMVVNNSNVTKPEARKERSNEEVLRTVKAGQGTEYVPWA